MERKKNATKCETKHFEIARLTPRELNDSISFCLFSLCSLLYNLKLVLCAFLCNRSIRPNVLMNESWSHVVGSQPHTSRFIFFAVSCLSRHQSSMNCSLRGSVKFLGWIQATSFESLRWFCDFYLPRRSNIIIESCCVVVYFLFSVEAIIFQ